MNQYKCARCGERVERISYHTWRRDKKAKPLCIPCHNIEHKVWKGPCEWVDVPPPRKVVVPSCPRCGGSGLVELPPSEEHPHGLFGKCDHVLRKGRDGGVGAAERAPEGGSDTGDRPIRVRDGSEGGAVRSFAELLQEGGFHHALEAWKLRGRSVGGDPQAAEVLSDTGEAHRVAVPEVQGCCHNPQKPFCCSGAQQAAEAAGDTVH